jgi:hypothetical protein
MARVAALLALLFAALGIHFLGYSDDRLGTKAAFESVQGYIAEATNLRDERIRALYVVECIDKAWEGMDPNATVTYDTLAQISEDELIRDLASRFKLALMESALIGDIVHEDHPFSVERIMGDMRAAAMRRLKE